MAQRFALSTVVLLTLAALLAGCRPIQAQVAPGQTEPASAENSEGYPAQLALPNMYMPEGIAISSDGTAYVGSIATGAIYQIDLRTGEGKMLVEPQEGHSLGGLAYDERTGLLFAAGGGKGNALIYDTATGEQRQDIQFVEDGGLVNDVTITDRAVYFSDSFKPVIYKLALDADGQVTEPLETTAIPLSGEYESIAGGLNANGIVAMHGGEYLVLDQTDSGRLYRVDPTSGEATQIELDSDVIIYHDGLVADGDILYIVNYNDRVYVVQMNPDGTSGKLVRTITDPNLDAISTAARYEDSLYVVNARWDTDLTPETPYWITRVDRAPVHSITTAPAAEQIANAMAAAPGAIAQDATILGFGAQQGDDMVVLRAGNNGWTCLTDWPVSPDNDPICYDPVFAAWHAAYAAGTAPEISGPGIAYRLGGSSVPSSSDPMAMQPPAGEKWIGAMPHVVVVMPGGFAPGVFSTDPHSGLPYVMWQGTPYEHLVIPVVAQGSLTTRPLAPTASADEQIQNMKTAASAAIIAGATLLGYPAEEGGAMVVLREGTNGWTCHPDDQATPRNDAGCDDAGATAGRDNGDTRAITQPGISYMLSGGSDASSVDPALSAPAPGEEWMAAPSRIVLTAPGGFDPAAFTTDSKAGYPYIMFNDTPYEQLVIPLAAVPEQQQ